MRRAARALVYLLPVAVVVDLGMVHARFIGHYPFLGDAGRLWWMAVYAVILALAAYTTGVTEPPRRTSEALWQSAAAVAGGAGVISLAQLALGSAVLPRFVVFGSAGLLVPLYVGAAWIGDRLRRSHGDHDRVVAVVGAAEFEALRDELNRSPEQPAALVAVLASDEAHPDGRGGLPLVEAVTATRASVVVLDRQAQADESVVAQAALVHGRGVRVRTLTLFYDQWLGKMPISELEQVSLMFDIQELHARRYARLKRCADVAVAVAGCAVLAAVTPMVLVADLVGNRGPLLFRQRRVGRGGTEFTMWKFRTMVPEEAGVWGACQLAEPAGAAPWTLPDDQRLGWVGRWLRRTHVDELPQVVNVLRGELSMVGPRPEQPGYVDELRQKIPFYDVRHLVHPGLTGWAQVKFPYGASVSDAMEKLQYEFYYLRHQGLALDARIVARTLRTVLSGRGR